MLSCLLFLVKFSLIAHLSKPYASGFHPMTVENHAVVSNQHFLVRFKIRDWLKCIVKCQNHPKCLSYNYRHRQRRVKGPLCELYQCGLDPRNDFKRSLLYSNGMIFQQLKPAKVSRNLQPLKPHVKCYILF